MLPVRYLLIVPYLWGCMFLVDYIKHPDHYGSRFNDYPRVQCQAEDVKGRTMVMLARKWSVWPAHDSECYPIIQYREAQEPGYQLATHHFTMNYAFIEMTVSANRAAIQFGPKFHDIHIYNGYVRVIDATKGVEG